MPVRTFPVDGAAYDDLHTARMLRSAATDGVVAGLANECEVQAQSPETDDVQVATGRGWARGGWLQVYDAPEVLDLAAASADDRWDRIVARRDASVDPITIGLAVLQGTPSATDPTKPALTQTVGGTWEVLLADVFVPAGSTQVYASQSVAPDGEGYIVDARTWSTSPFYPEAAEDHAYNNATVALGVNYADTGNLISHTFTPPPNWNTYRLWADGDVAFRGAGVSQIVSARVGIAGGFGSAADVGGSDATRTLFPIHDRSDLSGSSLVTVQANASNSTGSAYSTRAVIRARRLT